jgi:four helix bundle protein
MASKCFTDLEVWRIGHALVLEVYRLVRTFPIEERFELAGQMRSAAVSIPANIAEGFGRDSARDKARFYTMSRGSAEELRYYFILAKDLGYLADVGPQFSRLDSIGRMLRRLVQVTLSKV